MQDICAPMAVGICVDPWRTFAMRRNEGRTYRLIVDACTIDGQLSCPGAAGSRLGFSLTAYVAREHCSALPLTRCATEC